MVKKHVLITVGNKGIGIETTKLFLKRNFTVTILARDFTNFIPLENCNLIEFDLLDIDRIPALIDGIAGVDVLINNAGIMNTFAYNEYPVNKKK